MQTIKPKARWNGRLRCWLLTHPHGIARFSRHPHDGAVAMLDRVVKRMVRR